MEITTMNIIQILIFSSIAYYIGYKTGWIDSRKKLPVIAITNMELLKLKQVDNYD